MDNPIALIMIRCLGSSTAPIPMVEYSKANQELSMATLVISNGLVLCTYQY